MLDIYKQYKIFIYQYNGSFINGWHGDGNNLFFICNQFEKILYKISPYNPYFSCAARTDSGVHALYNLCNCIIYKSIDNIKLMKLMNYYLPEFIRIIEIKDTNIFFSSRHWSYQRSYEYKIYISEYANPLLTNLALHIKKLNLNINNMIIAQNLLLQMNNVKQFTLSNFQGSLRRTMNNIYIRYENMCNQQIICFGFEARSFAHHQIRIIMHYLIQVGLNKITLEQFNLLVNNQIFIQKLLVQPQGLYLINVKYINELI